MRDFLGWLRKLICHRKRHENVCAHGDSLGIYVVGLERERDELEIEAATLRRERDKYFRLWRDREKIMNDAMTRHHGFWIIRHASPLPGLSAALVRDGQWPGAEGAIIASTLGGRASIAEAVSDALERM